MKEIIALTLLVAALPSALAQGTLQFTVSMSGANEVPPNASLANAGGQFQLNGNTLNYSIGMVMTAPGSFFPTSAGIYGPATESQTGPLIFDLGNYTQTFNPPQIVYGGGLTLSGQQISQLESGLWYVNFTSSAYPGGEIRGQITLVPEPSTWALLGTGGLVVWWYGRRKRMG